LRANRCLSQLATTWRTFSSRQPENLLTRGAELHDISHKKGFPSVSLAIIPVLRIRDVCPGSRIRIFSSPVPGQKDSGCRILIFYPSQIPDPGVKKAPGSGFRIPDPQHCIILQINLTRMRKTSTASN
jgi:hypothetical protein